jgi:hypothetical protein
MDHPVGRARFCTPKGGKPMQRTKSGSPSCPAPRCDAVCFKRDCGDTHACCQAQCMVSDTVTSQQTTASVRVEYKPDDDVRVSRAQPVPDLFRFASADRSGRGGSTVYRAMSTGGVSLGSDFGLRRHLDAKRRAPGWVSHELEAGARSPEWWRVKAERAM